MFTTHRTHHDGFVTLEEAIREAIYAELAALEMPYGAIPVVAILALTTNTTWGERRALILRPNFFRAAYLERAMYFKPQCNADEAHRADRQRVKETCRLFSRIALGASAQGIDVKSLEEFASRVLAQVAYAHAFKLSYGPYVSNNLSINGQVVDFGAARAVKDWRRGLICDNQPAFGQDEVIQFSNNLKTLHYYVRKYGTGQLARNLSAAEIEERVQHEYSTLLSGFFRQAQLPPEALPEAIKLYKTQQREVIDYVNGTPSTIAPHHEGRDRLDLGAATIGQGVYAAESIYRNRPALFREELQEKIFLRLAEGELVCFDQIDSFISDCVISSLRGFLEVPRHFRILLQTSDLCSVGLLCFDERKAEYRAIFYGQYNRDVFRVFDTDFCLEEQKTLCFLDQARRCISVPMQASGQAPDFQSVEICGKRIGFPNSRTFHY